MPHSISIYLRLQTCPVRSCFLPSDLCYIEGGGNPLPPSTHTHTHTHIYIYTYRVSQEECARLREGVPYAKLYRYNPKHLSPKWNGYGDNGQRKVWSSCGSTHCTCRLTLSPPSSLNVDSHDTLSAGRWAVNFTP